MKVEINNRTRNRRAERIVRRIVSDFLIFKNLTACEVSIALIGDKTMRKLNKKWRQKDKTTDVLSFPDKFLPSKNKFEPNIKDYLGELILNLNQIKRQAKTFGNNFEQELYFICIHGLLHLLGYEDKTESGKKTMDKETKKILAKIKK